MSRTRRTDGPVVLGLIALALIPVLAGAVRLGMLAMGGPRTEESARFFEAPLPVVVHIICATVFSLLGAFQFAPDFRRRRPGWHRAAGRVLVIAAFGTALSGLWMAGSYAIVPADSSLLHRLRLLFGWAMVWATASGLVAIHGGHVAAHQAWMRRAYAIGLGAGTQALLLGPAILLFGEPDGTGRALMMGAGWVLNLAVAEWLIRSAPMHRHGRAHAG